MKSKDVKLRGHFTGDRDQDHPQEKEMQKKQNACLGRPYK